MTAPFRLYGAELSPYALKVRAYLRYKGLDFEWRERSVSRQDEFARYAKLPLAPLLVDADETVLQDSTPIIEALERDNPEPSIAPDDAALGFVAALLEDYADEWLNKAMFHYRWSYAADQDSAAQRTLDMMFEGAEGPDGALNAIKTRMSGRLHHIGSSPETAPAIEGSFTSLLVLLQRLLASRRYLFGGRPSLADFGLAGQLAQLLSDPTPGALIRDQAPAVAAWIERMQSPRNEGAFEPLDALRADLAELLRHEVAGAYLAWAGANAAAVDDDAALARVEIAGRPFVQKPQRYAAKALAELRRKRAALGDNTALAALLGETGCDAYLLGAEAAEEDETEEPGEQ